ncbi:hypothetical protein D3C75_1048850 [compost metagenome]
MFDAISFLNFTLNVSNHRVFHFADTAVFNRGFTPCVVNEFGVKRYTNDFYATFLEFFVTLVERNQFRRAHESEVHWPEEHNGGFTIGVCFEVEVFNDFATAENGCSGKVRGWTSNQDHMYSC